MPRRWTVSLTGLLAAALTAGCAKPVPLTTDIRNGYSNTDLAQKQFQVQGHFELRAGGGPTLTVKQGTRATAARAVDDSTVVLDVPAGNAGGGSETLAPLVRAKYLEKRLKTPARIYYKNESVSPAGSHKPNTAVAQAYYNKAFGIKILCTETGAGQWGSSVAMACNFFGVEAMVYMVRVSYDQKPYRRIFMESYGATVSPSPSPHTSFGRRLLAADPDDPGNLG